VARILIVGGGCRGRELACTLRAAGDAVRITTRRESRRAAIEATGAECWIGTPDRLATLRGALENVTILCWLLGAATGTAEELQALHSTRLEFFLTQAIDTTVRGLVYEAGGERADLLRRGEELARGIAARNRIPAAFLTADPRAVQQWHSEASAAITALLARA
jgi:hypothetical protein